MYIRCCLRQFTNLDMNVCARISQVSIDVHIMEHTNILCSRCMSYLFPRQTFFLLRQNTHAQETLTWKVQCFGCSPLVVVTWFWMFFFYYFEEGVFQPQKLEILERSLPKKSTTQQVWQPADFFRVDSQDLHFLPFLTVRPVLLWRLYHVACAWNEKSISPWGPGTAQKNMTLGWSEDDTRVG